MDGTQPMGGQAPMGTPGSRAGRGVIPLVDIARIMRAIPHRYPFLLIDRVVDVEPDRCATGIKNVSINEGFFQGHFPEHPVMPGVLIVEAMAQTCAVLVVETEDDEAGKLVYLMSIDGVKLRRPVVPGDQMRVYVEKARRRLNVWKFRCSATVDGVEVAQATLSAMIMDRAPETEDAAPPAPDGVVGEAPSKGVVSEAPLQGVVSEAPVSGDAPGERTASAKMGA